MGTTELHVTLVAWQAPAGGGTEGLGLQPGSPWPSATKCRAAEHICEVHSATILDPTHCVQLPQ